MKYLCELVAGLFGGITALSLLIAWLAGFVLAKGFGATLSCFIPFYAWYLVVERVMNHFGCV